MKSLLGNFYAHLAIFFWSHCSLGTYLERVFALEILLPGSEHFEQTFAKIVSIVPVFQMTIRSSAIAFEKAILNI